MPSQSSLLYFSTCFDAPFIFCYVSWNIHYMAVEKYPSGKFAASSRVSTNFGQKVSCMYHAIYLWDIACSITGVPVDSSQSLVHPLKYK